MKSYTLYCVYIYIYVGVSVKHYSHGQYNYQLHVYVHVCASACYIEWQMYILYVGESVDIFCIHYPL